MRWRPTNHHRCRVSRRAAPRARSSWRRSGGAAAQGFHDASGTALRRQQMAAADADRRGRPPMLTTGGCPRGGVLAVAGVPGLIGNSPQETGAYQTTRVASVEHRAQRIIQTNGAAPRTAWRTAASSSSAPERSTQATTPRPGRREASQRQPALPTCQRRPSCERLPEARVQAGFWAPGQEVPAFPFPCTQPLRPGGCGGLAGAFRPAC